MQLKDYEVWDEAADEPQTVKAHSLDDAVKRYAADLIREGDVNEPFDVCAREVAEFGGRWMRVHVEWEQRIDVRVGRARPCRDPRGEVGE